MDFEIFFSDLNEDAQKRLLEAVDVKDPAEMNWDLDICPIGLYPLPEPVKAADRHNFKGEITDTYLVEQ